MRIFGGETSAITAARQWGLACDEPAFASDDVGALLTASPSSALHVVSSADGRRAGIAAEGRIVPHHDQGGARTFALLATLPPVLPEHLGDPSFTRTHGVRFPYVAGEMAAGIASAALVIAAARAGLLGFFGAAGLSPSAVEAAIDQIEAALGQGADGWGVNLIHSPLETGAEQRMVELLLRRGVRRASASAFMSLTPAVVRYSATGLRLGADGAVERRNHLFAKISRAEVARHFLSPAPEEMLRALVAEGRLTAEEARLAATVPVAGEVTVEADSAGHTDNRPLVVLLPLVAALRDELAARHGYLRAPRIGAAGGVATPAGVAAAFALGASYVLTGSINQSAVEAGTSAEVKKMLAAAEVADVMMAPAADMFELGVKVQVLKRGTMFGVRAQLLYQLYLAHGSLEALPAAARARLEREHFQKPLEQVWEETARFFAERDPAQLERAASDPKHKMALVFRSYLGQASRWATAATPGRRMDYQVWCGPAMGAFNAWVAGSFLAAPENRTVGQIARNLLEGAAAVTRAHQLRSFGVEVPASAFSFAPRQVQ